MVPTWRLLPCCTQTETHPDPRLTCKLTPTRQAGTGEESSRAPFSFLKQIHF